MFQNRRGRLIGIITYALLLLTAGSVLAQTVQLCFDSLGPGQAISGLLPDGAGARTFWAGVLNVRVDGNTQTAYCTDIYNSISTGNCYSNSAFGVTDPMVACTMQYYPALTSLANEEAAARQAPVWHYSDNFTTTVPAAVVSRAQAIIADLEAKKASGLCDSVTQPVISVTPASAVDFLMPAGGSYETSSRSFTITVKRGLQPVSNQTVTVSATLGTLNRTTLTTDTNGQASVILSHNAPGEATLNVYTTVTLQAGTRIDPGPNIQKIAVSGSQQFTLTAAASQEWVQGAKIVIKKFHDRNQNQVFDGDEQLIDWLVEYRQSGTGGWAFVNLGPEGSQTVTVDPSKTYEICELPVTNWRVTLPANGVCYQNVEPGSTVWFGNVQTPALLIRKFHDLNGDGQRQATEPPLDGFAFQVDRVQPGPAYQAAYSGQTANGGLLGFAPVAYPQLYRISELPTAGWYAATAPEQLASVAQPASHAVEFGNLQPGQISIEKQWYVSGTRVNPPSTPANVCVKRDGPGTPYQTLTPTNTSGAPLTANAQGFYCQAVSSQVSFKNLWPGTYTITETSPAGWDGPLSIPDVPVNSGALAAVTIRNDQELGQLSVTKVVNWNGAQPDILKTFSICVSGPSFSAPNCQTIGYNGGVLTWANLTPGEYTVEETAPGAVWAVSGSGIKVSVTPNGAHTTITNTLRRGSLTVTKQVDWNGAPVDNGQTFRICISGPSGQLCHDFPANGASHTFTDLIPGVYTVVEDAPGSQWTVSGDNGVSLNIQANGSGSATITNTHQPPAPQLGSLKLTKVVNWNGAPVDNNQTFTICATGPSGTFCHTFGATGGSVQFDNLLVGSYTVTENPPGANWTVTGSGVSVSVAVGATAEATVANTFNPPPPQTGSLTVIKEVDWNGAPVEDGQIFHICISGPSGQQCHDFAANGGSHTFSNLEPGVYTITESAPGAIWTVSGSGVQVSVTANATTSATVKNTHQPVSQCPQFGQMPQTRSWKDGDRNDVITLVSGGPVTYQWEGVFTNDGYRVFGRGKGTLENGQSLVIEYPADWGPANSQGAREAHITVHFQGPCGYVGHDWDRYYHSGKLTVTKVVDWNGNLPQAASFEICISGPSFSAPNCKTVGKDGGNLVWNDLITGEYVVSETAPGANWTVQGSGEKVTVPPGWDGVTATVTNRHAPPAPEATPSP